MLFDFLFKMSRKSKIFSGIFKFVYHCDIPRKMNMGANVRFPHHALGVVINRGTTIGNNSCIQHHVLIGEKNGSGFPVIGDNVVINPYCIIIGNVTIGDYSIIGAGSIVTKDVPPNTVYYNKITPVSRTIDHDEYLKLTR